MFDIIPLFCDRYSLKILKSSSHTHTQTIHTRCSVILRQSSEEQIPISIDVHSLLFTLQSLRRFFSYIHANVILKRRKNVWTRILR